MASRISSRNDFSEHENIGKSRFDTLQKQSVEKDVQKRKEMGCIGLWLNCSENPRAPKYVGEMKNNKGTKFKISVWQNNSEQAAEKGERKRTSVSPLPN